MTEDSNVTQAIYERQQSESGLWFARFLLYRNAGPSRTLLGTVHTEQAKRSDKKRSKGIPGSWFEACERWQWKARAEQYDADQQAQAEERRRALLELEAEEEKRILTTGYALMHKRIEGLAEMADLIKKSFIDENATEKINFAWVTPDKIREYRGCLDDIAKELGQRVKKNELTGKDGGPLLFQTEWGGGTIEDEQEQGV